MRIKYTSSYTISLLIYTFGRLNNVDEIFQKIQEKIVGIIRFWDLFRLSLPGRISVVKTLLLPQLNYLGGILTPSRVLVMDLQRILDSFALKNLRVAAERKYIPAKLGRLGLINLETYLDAQKCSWISRASRNCIDNWRYDLKKLSPEADISRIRLMDLNQERHPILYNFVKSFTRLVESHAKQNGNYWVAHIFENGAFTWGTEEKTIGKTFFGLDFYERYKNKIRSLRLIDCYHDCTFKNLREFADMGLPIKMNSWLCLSGVAKKAIKKYKKADPLAESKRDELLYFLQRIKKG